MLIIFVDAELIKNGTSYLVSNNKLTGTSLEVLSFMSSGIKKRSGSDTSDGRPGRINYYSEDEYRTISMTVESTAEDMQDVAHLRDAVNELFDGEMFIREMRIKDIKIEYERPGERTGELQLEAPEYVNGKQIKVAHVNNIEIDDTTLVSTFTVEFETTELPYFETIYTTLELNDTGFDATAEKYGLVDNIDDEKVKYRFEQDLKSNFIPNSDTRKASNIPSWKPRGTDVTMNSSVQTNSWFLLQVSNSGTYIATESNLLAFDLIEGEEYTLTYFAQPGASVTSMNYNWLIRSEHPNLKLPTPEVSLNHGIRTGTTYYNKYDVTFTAEFTGKCSVLIGGNLASGSNTFLYFSYPRLYKGTESKSWSEVIPDGGTTSFTVYNAGNVTIEPESMYLNIGMRYATTSGGFKIRNETTGEEHIINSAHERRHLRLNGMVATSGNLNNFRNTNRRFISLYPGDNKFTVSGGTFEEIEIDFKYLYK